VRGDRIGTPTELAAIIPGVPLTVTRYGGTTTVTADERRCLWPRVFRSRPVRVIIVTEPGRPSLAQVTTDLAIRRPRSSSATPPDGPSRYAT
jgi:hypothetical protein